MRRTKKKQQRQSQEKITFFTNKILPDKRPNRKKRSIKKNCILLNAKVHSTTSTLSELNPYTIHFIRKKKETKKQEKSIPRDNVIL